MSAHFQKTRTPPTKGRGSRLVGKMILFVEKYMLLLNATEAYVQAGYKVKDRDAATRNAHELMNHPLVKAEIEKRTAERGQKNELTVEYVVKRLVDIVEASDQKPEAMLRGLELLGRHLGMYRDKQEISGPDGNAIQVQEQRVAEEASDFKSRIAGITKRTGTGTVLEFPHPGSDGEPKL